MSGIYRILIADPIAPEGLAPLTKDAQIELVQGPGSWDPAELRSALATCDAVIVRSATRITRELMEGADRLRVIGRAGVGVDNIDVKAATERGIAVLNAPSGNTTSAAELTMALLLALARKVPAADQSMRTGGWNRKLRGVELYGKTLGLIGAGRIGGEVAKRAQGFGMHVVAHDPFLSDERAAFLKIERASLEDVLRRADVLSLHVPLTQETAGLIGERELAFLKPGALLVNAARGGVVDEDALAAFLVEGRLGGAALDVYEKEPLPADHPLRELDNIVLTPHLGAATTQAQINVALEIADAVRSALVDNDLSRAINAPAIGSEEMRRLAPMLDLADRLGRLAVALSKGSVESVEVRYTGSAEEVLRPLTAGALIGVLSVMVGRGAVNFVNSIHLAAERGIEMQRVRLPPHADYAEYLELRLSGGGTETRVAGALLAEGFPRVVRVNDFHVDVIPQGTLVVLQNQDVPGVIGRVGTMLGGAGVNIAEYHQARLQAGGEALAAISVDERLNGDLTEQLAGIPEVRWVRQVELD